MFDTVNQKEYGDIMQEELNHLYSYCFAEMRLNSPV